MTEATSLLWYLDPSLPATRLTRLSTCVRSIPWALAIAHAVPCRIGIIKNLLSSLAPMSRVTLVSRKLGRLFQTGATSIPEQGRQECSQATRFNYCRFVFHFQLVLPLRRISWRNRTCGRHSRVLANSHYFYDYQRRGRSSTAWFFFFEEQFLKCKSEDTICRRQQRTDVTMFKQRFF